MNISIMGGWNTDSGGSLHSENIGREFIKIGHKLKIFTFYHYAFHGSQITGENEEYVTPCFTHFDYNPLKLDVIPFITSDYELFIAEDIGMFPKDLLAKIFNTHIKKKAKTISIYHDCQLSNDPAFYQFDWDAIVCFDKRYKDILTKAYPKDIIHIIPFPCMPWLKGDKKEARKKLNLPLDKKIIFTFGPNTNRVLHLLKDIDMISKDYPAMILALTKDRIVINELNKLKKNMKTPIIIEEEAPSVNRLYNYLHASDCLLYYREPRPYIVVASTISQCIGAGCPILGNNSKYTEMFDNEIFKYDNPEELLSRIKEIFEESKKYKLIMENAKKYTLENSSEQIAKKFIKLYESL